jgi:predicted enzyme related to lactoylglutathione lyase
MTTYSHVKPVGTPTWLDLTTPDAEAARKFYHAVFGWEYDVAGPEFGGYAIARVGERMAAGVGPQRPGTPPMPAAWTLYFASSDAGADAARAEKLGGRMMAPAMAIGDFGRMAICVDPGGASFGFWQAGQHVGAQVTDEPGSMSWNELYAPDAKIDRDFYAALLGATADPMPGGMEYYVLKHGDEQLAGIMPIDPSWGGFRPQWLTYFAVANADDVVATVKRNGGKALSGVDDSPFGRIAALADPQGGLFKIVQPPAK